MLVEVNNNHNKMLLYYRQEKIHKLERLLHQIFNLLIMINL
jgi:hypothetical protein